VDTLEDTQFSSVPNPTPLQTALGVGSTLSGIYGNIMGPVRIRINEKQSIKKTDV
jgi:hypothetical protein